MKNQTCCFTGHREIPESEFSCIKLFLALPFKGQGNRWSLENKETYYAIFESADDIAYTSNTYYRGCMHARNRHLVDNSNYCICYLTKPTGGTAYTVNYAKKKGLEIVNTALLSLRA